MNDSKDLKLLDPLFNIDKRTPFKAGDTVHSRLNTLVMKVITATTDRVGDKWETSVVCKDTNGKQYIFSDTQLSRLYGTYN